MERLDEESPQWVGNGAMYLVETHSFLRWWRPKKDVARTSTVLVVVKARPVKLIYSLLFASKPSNALARIAFYPAIHLTRCRKPPASDQWNTQK